MRRRTHHPTKGNKKEDKLGEKLGDEGRQHLGKADAPSNKKGDKLGYKLGDKGHKALGRRRAIQQGIKKGDNVRQGETRHREGGRTIQQRETKLGDKLGKQSVRTWTHHPTKGNK